MFVLKFGQCTEQLARKNYWSFASENEAQLAS